MKHGGANAMSSPFYFDPAVIQWVTANLDKIGTDVAAATAAAAIPTAGVLGPAVDEVSTAVASLFGQFADEYQTLAEKAAAFHDQFTRTMGASAAAYQSTEAASAADMLQAAIRAPGDAINGFFTQATGRGGVRNPV